MGQEPLIDDDCCTTRLPANVDEEVFLPSSTSLCSICGYGAVQTDAQPGYSYGGSSTSGTLSISQQQRPRPPSLLSASDEFVSHDANSSPHASRFVLPMTSSPYGLHAPPPGQPSYESQNTSGMQGNNTPPTPHNVSAHPYPHPSAQQQPPPLPPQQQQQHHQDTHMHSYTPTSYDATMHSDERHFARQHSSLQHPAGDQLASRRAQLYSQWPGHEAVHTYVWYV